MKTLLLPSSLLTAFALFFAIAILPPHALAQSKDKKANSPYQQLVSNDGTAIEAEIISVDNDNNVRIRRSDRQEFTFPISMLDKKSQALVKGWAVDRAISQSLEIRVRERTIDKTKVSDNSSTGEKIVNELQITLNNKSAVAIDGLRIEYRMYCKRERIGVNNSAEEVVSGDIEVGTLAANSDKMVKTESVTLLEEKLRANFIPASGNRRSSKDSINGYWYKVYRGKNLIMEDAAPKRLMNVKDW